MFKDLDDTLKKWLEQELPQAPSAPIKISFATPTEGFLSKDSTPPLVNLFLYDVRQNLELRTGEAMLERRGDTASILPPPMRVDCSYLVTAWASGKDKTSKVAEQEHWILGAVAEVLVRYPVLPEAILQGKLKGQKPPLPALALNGGHLHSPSEFWQAMGGKPRPALHYTVTLSLETAPPRDAGLPVLEAAYDFYQDTHGDGR